MGPDDAVNSQGMPHLCAINSVWYHVDGSAQHCSNSIVLAMELLQSCTKPSMCSYYSVCAIKHLKQSQYENAILQI